MNAAEILIAARERIAVPERWTQGKMARDTEGRGVHERSPAAICWCAAGALAREAYREPGEKRAYELLRHGARSGSLVVSSFNDAPGRTHPEVLAAFDRAIELAKAEAGQ